MNRGTVAIIDALGWRGIWKRTDPRDVIQKLESLERHAKLRVPIMHDRWKNRLGADSQSEPSIEVSFLSDTLVVAVSFGTTIAGPSVSGESLSFLYTRSLVVEMVADILLRAAIDSPALIYRGAIASGMLYVQNTRLIGEAVDRAAELMHCADGAFVFVDPKDIFYDDMDGLLDYDVPLRDGRSLRANVVNPFAACDSADSIKSVFTGYKEVLENDNGVLDVIIKRDNTEGLLKKGRAAQLEALSLKSGRV